MSAVRKRKENPAAATARRDDKLQEVFDDLSPTGQELFAISLGTADRQEELMTTAEIRAEMSRRRGVASGRR